MNSADHGRMSDEEAQRVAEEVLGKGKPKASPKSKAEPKARTRAKRKTHVPLDSAPKGYIRLTVAGARHGLNPSQLSDAVRNGQIKAVVVADINSRGRRANCYYALPEEVKAYAAARKARMKGAAASRSTPRAKAKTPRAKAASLEPEPPPFATTPILAMGSTLAFYSWLQQGLKQQFLTTEEGARFLERYGP
jgi:hypothetical protein